MLVMVGSRRGSYSSSTSMGEVMLIARKIPDGQEIRAKPRIKLISLNQMPESRLEAIEIAKIVRNNPANKLETGWGSTSIKLGDVVMGNMLDCPSDGNGEWDITNAADSTLTSFIHAIVNDAFEKISITKIEISTLDENKQGMGKIGKVHRDIADDNKPDGKVPRAPFMRMPYIPSTKYPCLWANNHVTQRQMIVEPDTSLEVKPAATKIRVDDRWNTATHVHINNQVGYGSQRLVSSYTTMKTLGGSAWPNVILKKEFEKAFVVWCNSVFGILTYWLVSGSQQPGRGRMGVKAFRIFPMLDLTKLTKAQLGKFDNLFDYLSKKTMLPINRIDEDEIRQELDKGIQFILGTDFDLIPIYDQIVKEPQFGRKSDSEPIR